VPPLSGAAAVRRRRRGRVGERFPRAPAGIARRMERRFDREDDVDTDPQVANSRATGGGPDEGGDAESTTGTGASEEFVGRAGGQDAGFAGETGAEARSEAERAG
jgi:hypothetical protein